MLAHSDQNLSQLLVRLYGGIDAPRPWEDFLENLADWLGASFATLIIAALDSRNPGTFLSPGADPESSRLYVERFFANDPFRSLPDGQVTSFAEFAAAQGPNSMAEYRQFLSGIDGERVLAVDLRFPGRFEARFRLTRTGDRPDYTVEDRNRLQGLVPHLRIAVSLFEKLQFAGAEHQVFRNATEGLGLALLVIDRQSRQISANSLAELLLAEGEGIRRSGNEVRFDSLALRKRVDALLGHTTRGVARFRIVRPEHGDLIATARAIELPAIHSGTGALALFLARPGTEPALDPDTVRELLGVTPAEARLCVALAQGFSLVDAASRLGIAHNTAKVQLRSIFAKTQVHRQSQLVGLLGGLPG